MDRPTANEWLSILEASGQVVLLEPWFSNRTKSIVKSPKLYLADTGLLCALLNIRSKDMLRRSPAAGAVWETFVLAQLRHRESRAGRRRSVFFWRDRRREVDFVTEAGGRMDLFEAKWTELPSPADAVNLDFVRNVVGSAQVAGAGIVCRAANSFPLSRHVRVLPVTDLEQSVTQTNLLLRYTAEDNEHFVDRQELLAAIKERLLNAQGRRFRAVVLYGSEARGEARPDSYLDLLVLLDGPIDYGKDLRTNINAL